MRAQAKRRNPAGTYYGRVDDAGKLHAENPRGLNAHIRTHAGHAVEIIVRRRRRSQRSVDQNAWLWGCALKILGEEFGYDRHEHEELHYALIGKCFGTKWDMRLQREVNKVRSSKLTTKVFSEYMEWLVRFAAVEYKTIIPLPDEVDLDALADEIDEAA